MTQFRIGGHYYNKNRDVVVRILERQTVRGHHAAEYIRPNGDVVAASTSFRLWDGRGWLINLEGVDSTLNLIPGELHQVNGEWVARGYEEAKPAKSIGKLLREKAEADAQAYYASKTPTLDKLENTTERQRPRLTWDAPVRIDRFPGFTVKSDTTEVEAFPHPLARSPDLEQSSHLMDPRYALAANKA